MIPALICASATVCALVTSLPNFEHAKTKRLGMGREQEIKLQRDCEAMNSEGKISDLLSELQRHALELSTLRFEPYEKKNFYRIRQLRADIHRVTQRAKSILRPEWTDSRWPYRATWQLRFENVTAIDARVIPTNFAFSSFDLEGLSLGGIEREDLYPLIVVTTKPTEITIDIEKSASSLELCQLQSTWAVEGTLKYKFQNQDVVQTVDLSLRPGVIQPPEQKPEPPKETKPETLPLTENLGWPFTCRGAKECGWTIEPNPPLIPWPKPVVDPPRPPWSVP